MDIIALANRINDHLVPRILGAQIRQPGAVDDGGLLLPEKGFAEPARSAFAADTLISAYLSPNSRYCGDEAVLRGALQLLAHLVRNTHADGTIDLLETNFHDATCNGFSVQVLGYTHRLMKDRAEKSALERAVFESLEEFLGLSARAMREGGFHTPNHRWVLASALSLCYRELGDEGCLATARLYLDEGMDCDEEGEYTERSAGIYDVVCNHSLMILVNELDRPELAECVLRNLDKLAHYVEPDGSVLTLNSRRQDYGKRMDPYRHTLPCLLALAHPHDPGDSRFARAAGLLAFLFRQYEEVLNGLWAPQDAGALVTHLLLRPELAQVHPAEALPERYERLYPKAGVLRRRDGNATLTLVRDNATFMKLQVGSMEMLVRLSASYYARGQFRAEAIEPAEGGWRMRYSHRWGYKRPLGDRTGTPVWADMPHHLREDVNMLTWNWEVAVLPGDRQVTVHIHGDGCDRLPWALECALTAGGMLSTETAFVPGKPGNWVAHRGACAYRLHNDEIRFQGGSREHWYAPNMRGSEAPREDRFTVYATGFAPVDERIVFSWDEPSR
ncbi:MAG TPA: hypothetical protein PKE04_14180 [Clostridia bacterium]|nr:hypothetical protein [Clostridia bacterium]